MTVMMRRIIATPARSASDAWGIVIELLAAENSNPARKELAAVANIASLIIADEATKSSPIIVYGSGPRIRIYCLYDDDAIEGDQAKESPFAFNPTEGNWQLSLPCQTDDLEWVHAALKKHSTRITARDMLSPLVEEDTTSSSKSQSTGDINMEAFFRP
ncbi:hypothetical protein [Herpetosiphon giganteus]|uniref:hypothetical protein n=1 Tax=Herpetosiphon giganteus TaxID=2029754 RepID=UPI00195D63E6|nr:hypothetical protein [Herpetosiphon giganteus]MBM7842176.1 hypothetical protein [Herpetosiphon giganteus]